MNGLLTMIISLLTANALVYLFAWYVLRKEKNEKRE